METITTHDAPHASRVLAPGALARDGVHPHLSVPHENLLLAAAPNPGVIAGLTTRLTLPAEVTLYEVGATITHYFFPVNGITSIVMEMDDSTVEVGTVGPEGMLGLPALLGVPTTSTRTFTQSICTLDRVAIQALDDAMDADPALRMLLLRYAEAYLDEVSQSVACNRLHTLEQRCARWLLLTHDRTGSDEIKLKQRVLSYMLGVHRPAVSLAAGALQRAGVIRYSRGTIRILDRLALEAASCGCYQRGRDAYARARLTGTLSAVGGHYTFTTPPDSRAAERPTPIDDALVADARRLLMAAMASRPPNLLNRHGIQALFAMPMMTLCATTAPTGVPVEKLIVAIKLAWASMTEARLSLGDSAPEVLSGAVTACIEAYFQTSTDKAD